MEFKDKLAHLKLIFEFPRLFLTEFFSDLKSQVDISFAPKELKEKDAHLKSEIKQNWLEIIYKIEAFEKECFRAHKPNAFNEPIRKEIAEAILFIENNLDSQKNLILTIDHLTYKLEKTLFLNRTIAFITRSDEFERFFKKLNKRTTVGKLVYITNAYFSKFVINLLQKNANKKAKANDLTNDLIKLEMIQKVWFSELSSKQIDELKLETNKIDLSLRYLSKLSEPSLFARFDDLTQIHLVTCNLANIDENMFEHTKSLQVLDLSYNKLRSIHKDTFKCLNKLAVLKLSFNDLHSIDPCLFQDLISLNELGLVRNFLKEIHKDTFKGLINLNRLCLEYNQLEELDLNTFNELSNILHLDLSFNKLKLKHIHRQLFENLVRLEWINLSNNCLKNEEKLDLILPPSVKFISFRIGFCGNNIELMQ